jgi:hypothetical protein
MEKTDDATDDFVSDQQTVEVVVILIHACPEEL